MKLLLNLIGEQPIPNILPGSFYKPDKTVFLFTETTQNRANQLKATHDNSEAILIYPYDFNKSYKKLDKVLSEYKQDEIICNITGGTKIMSVVLFQLALKYEAEIIYLRSEGKRSIIYSYKLDDDNNLSLNTIEVPEVINVHDYVQAHIPYFDIVTSENNGSGQAFEDAIAKTLEQNGFEIVQNIKPRGEGNQLEIDLAVRLKGTNNVGIAEIKIGDKKEEGPKKGIDQLALASQREYLGTYTKRFLITSKSLSKQIKELANKHKIRVIDEISTDKYYEKLTAEAEDKLIQILEAELS